MNNIEIVNKIKMICGLQHLKISALLKKAGLSPNVIDDWKNNKTEPSFPALFHICEVLNIQIEELYTTDELRLTESQLSILKEWKTLEIKEKQAIWEYIDALKSDHK